MKKPTQKLNLHRETIRTLDIATMKGIVGGAMGPTTVILDTEAGLHAAPGK